MSGLNTGRKYHVHVYYTPMFAQQSDLFTTAKRVQKVLRLSDVRRRVRQSGEIFSHFLNLWFLWSVTRHLTAVCEHLSKHPWKGFFCLRHCLVLKISHPVYVIRTWRVLVSVVNANCARFSDIFRDLVVFSDWVFDFLSRIFSPYFDFARFKARIEFKFPETRSFLFRTKIV